MCSVKKDMAASSLRTEDSPPYLLNASGNEVGRSVLAPPIGKHIQND